MPAPKQFALPFAAQSENRKDPFSKETEAAAIFALSELERKSGGLTNKPEKIAYIAKVGYPLWLIVGGNSTYVFDGLNKSSFLWNFYEASQTEFVIEDFEANFRIREQYLKFLGTYQKSFQQSINKKELPCKGLIANSDFLDEMNLYRKEATETWSQPNLGLLAPVLKETDAVAVVNQIETLQSAFREKTEKLKWLTELISKTTKSYVEGLHFEANAVTDEAEAKIKAQKEIINPKIQKFTDDYKKQIDRFEKSIEKEQVPLEKQKSHLEKTIKETETNIEHYNKQAKTQSNKGNKRSEESLKKKIKKEKRELDELKKQQKSVEKQLKTLIEQKTEETSRLKTELERKVSVERQPIVDIEAKRDLKLEIFNQETFKLEKLTYPVLEELGKFVAQREGILSKMEPLSLESDPKQKSTALIYVPFYIAVYNGADYGVKRYRVFPPALVGSLGLSAKFKGALGQARIKDLFSPRFKAVAALGEKIRLNASASSEFGAQIEALTQRSNVLTIESSLKSGLVLLKEEGWLSEADFQNLASAVSANKST
jgi:predicted  nucleic acid-binding Zn-ribbon protein